MWSVCDVLHRAGADIEDQLLAVTKLHQEACRRLAVTGSRHAGAAGRDANLVFFKCLRAGVVHVAIRRYPRRVLDDATGGKRTNR
jgi:hypothetical protein